MIEERLLNIRFERDRLYDERQKRIVRQVEVPTSLYRMEDAPSRAATSPADAPAVQDFKFRTSSTTWSQLTTKPFAALNVNQYVKQATVGYEFMTKVQAQTLPTTLLKTNLIAKA
eukprot:scaffold138_cov145-Chaetoceros_neogracile.AAC.4